MLTMFKPLLISQCLMWSRAGCHSLPTADVSSSLSPLRDVSRGERYVPPRETSLSGDKRGETSAVRRLSVSSLVIYLLTI